MNPAAAAPTFTNRLQYEKSPYLLQHQHNPVDWYAWGPEAFARAKAENKPIFLSIGYSTCHWCHVMAHESFEDPKIAQLLNEHFVSIKVDREERPDVDRVYMTYVQATSGGGGWPMSVFLTPDLKPFYGGTYFPPTERYGRPGFPTLLTKLAEAWRDDRTEVVGAATQAIEALRAQTASTATVGGFGAKEIAAAYDQLARSYDEEWGGFGSAPKFPRPVSLNLLFRIQADEGRDSAKGKEALRMALGTLRKMAAGGMHDQLGGGFHRYSVDRFWHIPHFEKMLYDQAQLASSYLDAIQVTGDPAHGVVVRDILDYVLRDLRHPAGGFFSAEDADSLLVAGRPEHGEGAFYVWTQTELAALLGPAEAKLFARCYGIEPDGNAPAGSDPHQEFKGQNTLIQRLTVAAAALEFGRPEAELVASLAASCAKLLEARNRRPRPHLDDKIITAWNGYMISAFARASSVLEEPRYLEAAQRAAQFIQKELWRDGKLIRSYRQGASNVAGFADDYAALIQGLLDLYEADFDVAWLRWSFELQAAMDQQFWDPAHGGYYSVGQDAPDILLRMKEDYDGAEPSPNSIAAMNLQRLSQLSDSPPMREQAIRTVQAFAEQLGRSPTALPQMLCAADSILAQHHRQIIIAGPRDSAETKALLREVSRRYLPDRLLLLADGAEGQKWLGEKLEFLRTAGLVGGKPAAYFCEDFVCRLPVTDPAKLAEEIDHAKR